MIAQKMMIAVRFWASVIARAPIAYPSRPITYARLRPIRSPTLLPIRMNAAETSASSAIADWTPLAVVPRSRTTAEIETFISEVSTTSTNIAIASRTASFVSPVDSAGRVAVACSVIGAPPSPALASAASSGAGDTARRMTGDEATDRLYGVDLDEFGAERARLVKELRGEGRREEAAQVGK